ncbi:MAG TPA: hypothetical protein VJ984_15370 [Xanthomonadales bacterium]|nr:hypothetical protein [Xanthomonadales bacterium]
MDGHYWTDTQFDDMSWHDNHIHGFRVLEGEQGLGVLELDIDYILEWLKEPNGRFRFRILPSTLRFIDVCDLRMSLDYAAQTAALGPFSIHSIERLIERRERYDAKIWKIELNWPVGEITFEASGFEQQGRGQPVVHEEQCLTASMRSGEADQK